MSTQLTRILFFVASCSIALHARPFFECVTHPCDSLCCSLIGLQDASPYYTTLAQDACCRCGLQTNTPIPVKKMNSLFTRLTNNEIVSFTLGSIWVNEKIMDQMSESERIFNMQHEVMHYLSNHPTQVLAAVLGSSIAVSLVTAFTGKYLARTRNKFTRRGIILASAFATLATLHEVLFQPLSKKHEQQAEIAAAKLLCKTGRSDILQEHINYLKSLLNKGISSYGTWWPSIAEQIAYLTVCMESYQNQKEQYDYAE